MDAAVGVLDARRHPSQLYFSHFATRMVDHTIDLYAAKPDIRPESHFCLPHLHSTPSLGGFPSEYRHSVWYGKTRMVGLPDGEKVLKIHLAVSIEYQRVSDGRTGGQTDGHLATA